MNIYKHNIFNVKVCFSGNIHVFWVFLLVFLAGAGGETVPESGCGLMTSDDLPEPGLALPGSDGVISLLLRFGGATGAGAGSDTVGFDVAAAAVKRSIIRMGENEFTEFNIRKFMKLPFLAWSCANLASRSCCRVFFTGSKKQNQSIAFWFFVLIGTFFHCCLYFLLCWLVW